MKFCTPQQDYVDPSLAEISAPPGGYCTIRATQLLAVCLQPPVHSGGQTDASLQMKISLFRVITLEKISAFINNEKCISNRIRKDRHVLCG